METVHNWVLTIALAALAGGVVWLLAPKGSVQKAVRTVVAVFLLCAFLSPLLSRQGTAFQWLAPELPAAPALPALEGAIAGQIQAAVKQELERRIAGVLDGRKITGQILLDMDILPEGGINIATAKVVLPPGTNTAGLAFALEETAGCKIEVEVEPEKEHTQR